MRLKVLTGIWLLSNTLIWNAPIVKNQNYLILIFCSSSAKCVELIWVVKKGWTLVLVFVNQIYFQPFTMFILKYGMSFCTCWNFKITGDWLLPCAPLSEMSNSYSKREKHVGRSHRSLQPMLGWWSRGGAEGNLLHLPITNHGLHAESRCTKKEEGFQTKTRKFYVKCASGVKKT